MARAAPGGSLVYDAAYKAANGSTLHESDVIAIYVLVTCELKNVTVLLSRCVLNNKMSISMAARVKYPGWVNNVHTSLRTISKVVLETEAKYVRKEVIYNLSNIYFRTCYWMQNNKSDVIVPNFYTNYLSPLFSNILLICEQ